MAHAQASRFVVATSPEVACAQCRAPRYEAGAKPGLEALAQPPAMGGRPGGRQREAGATGPSEGTGTSFNLHQP